ncbi:MAG: hypothetical protein KatS3mg115_0929 [Candidatus Poribacteria bacterium]|nr:MAG: hypothetical protein KatS3mg115_0929 [Candidatus Poribacteria bacterium]
MRVLSGLLGGLMVIAWMGCGQLAAQVFAPQDYGTNLTQLPGTESNHPAFIDGDLKTAGETTFPTSEGTADYNIASPPSEAVILFPEPVTVRVVRIHSQDIKGLDLLVEDPNQGWELVDKYDGLKGPVIELRPRGIVRGTGIKLRIRSTVKDAELRRRNVRRTGGGIWVTGETRAPATIQEIEVFGSAASLAATEAIEEPSSERTGEVESILMEDLMGR